MEYRNLEVTLVSADGLKAINLIGKMDLYAVAYITGLPETNQKTKVDTNCGTTPRWNHKLKFTLQESSLTSPPAHGLYLVVQIMAEKFGADKDIGEVRLNVLELLKDGVNVEKMANYKIEGRGKGTLSISYKFGETFSNDAYGASKTMEQAPLAYPPPNNGGYGQAGAAPSMPPQQGAYMDKGYGMGGPPPAQYGYSPYQPQPPAGYPPAGYPAYGAPAGNPGYGAPPPQGYGGYYPPPQGGYAPAPYQSYGGYGAQNQKKKKGGMMGMGLGLGAGLLGGMLIGDMVGDAAESVGDAAAYADGYGDAMGDMGGAFDF